MNWAAIAYICLMCLSVGITMARHGPPREPYDAGAAIFGFAICMTLLWFAGFFE